MNRLNSEALPKVIRPATLTSPETLGRYSPARIKAVREADAAEAILSSNEPTRHPHTGSGIENSRDISSSNGSRGKVCPDQACGNAETGLVTVQAQGASLVSLVRAHVLDEDPE